MTFTETEVNLAFIKVNAIDRGSGLHFSKTHLQGRYVYTLKNQGFGENNGDRNTYHCPIYIVNDDDRLDNNAYTKG